MSSEPVESLREARLRPPPFVAVIDANVFGRSAWIRPIVRAAEDGILIAVWSPLIISEVNRLLTWLWIRRHDNDTSESARRQCSANFKVWYANVAVHFQVVEDRPPLAEMWTDTPPDLWDAPIWTAAVRALDLYDRSGVIVVTDNLKDGPPPDEHGLRQYNHVAFIHPVDLVQMVARWQNISLTGMPAPADELHPEARSGSSLSERDDLGSSIEAFLRLLWQPPEQDNDST